MSPLSLGGIDPAADDLRELGVVVASFSVDIGFEALAWGRHVWDYRDAWEIVRRADHPRVGLILDSWHTLARGLPTDPIWAIPADRMTFVQLADAPKMDMDLLQWSRHFRNFPGQGDMPVDAFMAAVLATGYEAGSASKSSTTASACPAAAHRRGRRALADPAGDRARPGALPPRVRPRRWSGSSLRCPRATRSRCRRCSALGFAHGAPPVQAGRPVSQGEINLVINTEPEGLAHSHFIGHGPSVVALGLRVGDAAAALARAKALRMPAFHQPVGPGELDIPAVAGSGGSLIYFTDRASDLSRVWEVEFEPAGGAPGDGLARVDHIAQSIP